MLLCAIRCLLDRIQFYLRSEQESDLGIERGCHDAPLDPVLFKVRAGE